MSKLCRIDIERSEEILDELKKFVRKLQTLLPVKEVYLFGSFATGEVHEGSDIDLLIIGELRERFFERTGKIIELTDLPIEPLVYTSGEFEMMRSSGNPFILNILKTARKLL